MTQNNDLTDHAVLVATLSAAREFRFAIDPPPSERKALATDLDASQIRKLRFHGTLSSIGKRDWQLRAKLGATVVQPCVQTLEPVVTRIDTEVLRRFIANWQDMPEAGSETEMPVDDSTEPLGAHIDPWMVMVEALALALPDYPRAENAPPLEKIAVTEPGKTPMRDEDAKPFAGLAALKDQLGKPQGDS